MKAGMFFLVTAYVLSQFYRAFLAVLSPVLEAEIGAGPEDLAIASGLWFVSFAAMQIPIGWALDSIGPRRTACGLLALGGGGGAVVMALAQTIWVLILARVVAGITSATYTTIYAMVADIYDGPERSAKFGLIAAGFGIGLLLATATLALGVFLARALVKDTRSRRGRRSHNSRQRHL